jgi:hypothetical protein
MAYRTEIDRALDEVVSDEGNRFQTIAAIHIFAARYDFILRGVNAGNPSPTTRTFSVGVSFSGLCVEHPELFQELRTQKTGCVVRKKHWWEYLFGLP